MALKAYQSNSLCIQVAKDQVHLNLGTDEFLHKKSTFGNIWASELKAKQIRVKIELVYFFSSTQ
jgi:hypothetical protein